MKRFLKVLAYIVLLIILIIGGIVGYVIYDDYQIDQKRKAEKQALLSWEESEGWNWHQEFDRIQIKTVDGRSVLRRIYPEKDLQVWGFITDNGLLNGFAIWHVPCEPETSIQTDQSYSDGELMELRCHSEGDRLILQSVWPSGETDVQWYFEYGGFSISEDYSEWDFTKLQRENTLSRALKPEGAEEFLGGESAAPD